MEAASGAGAKRARQNGWTPERRERFLDTLAATGSVTQAARKAGMTASGAYQLRQRDREFFDSWALAVKIQDDEVLAAVRDRVIRGVERTVFQNGVAAGANREYSDRLAIYLLDRLERMGAVSGGDSGRSADALCKVLTGRMKRLGLLED